MNFDPGFFFDLDLLDFINSEKRLAFTSDAQPEKRRQIGKLLLIEFQQPIFKEILD